MIHIEGILKKVELQDNNLYLEFKPYGESTLEKISVDAELLFKKLLINEKIGMVVWPDNPELDDTISIRGVGKDIPIVGRYS